MDRIKGIDSIRFVCAVFVLFGHLGFPLPGMLKGSLGHGNLENLGKLIQLIFNGPAAVIIFFIISGFCIHYPFKEVRQIDLLPYYVRRLLRICTPVFFAVIIYHFNNVKLTAPDFGVFWSIICEVMYYLIYPGLFYIRKFIKWEYIILTTYLISILLLLTHLNSLTEAFQGYTALGYLTFLIGLPCWVLGCWLAENYVRFKALSVGKIWLFRIFILLIVLLLNIVKFHVHTVFASNCFTLNIFAFLACVWIGYEIMHYKHYASYNILEWCGKWSYSLYIMHPITPSIIFYLGVVSFFGDPITLISCLIVAFAFYLLIEKPSHKLSAFISFKLSNKHQKAFKKI